MEVITLDKLDFRSYSIDKKKEAFVSLDAMMKELHKRNMMVLSFSVKDIAFENGIYYFLKTAPIDSHYADNKDDAIYKNIMTLSNLALCMYLPDFILNDSLLNHDTILQNFKDFKTYFPTGDANYYESILVDSYNKRSLPEVKYYTDYLNKKSHDLNGNNNSMVMVKATEAGKAWAREDEAAFTNTFLLLLSVFSITIALIMAMIFFGIRI